MFNYYLKSTNIMKTVSNIMLMPITDGSYQVRESHRIVKAWYYYPHFTQHKMSNVLLFSLTFLIFLLN